MTRKFKYHRDLNKFEELPGMEEPEMPDEHTYPHDAFISYDLALDGYYSLWGRWNQHIKSLRDGVHNPMIDGSPECKEVFEDGQVVEIKKDIWIIRGDVYTALPLKSDKVREEELWNEALCFYFNQKANGVAEPQIVNNLTEKYSLTRK